MHARGFLVLPVGVPIEDRLDRSDPARPAPPADVLSAARALKRQTVAEARGCCMAASLDLCLLLGGRAAELGLIVWSVTGDREFLDHWGVLLADGRVLDLTRVQVDGRPELIHDIDDYPPHFRRPRVYPATLLLPAYERCADADTGRLPEGFMRRSRWLMFRHDLGWALRGRALLRAGHSLLSLGKFNLVHAIGRARRLLEARLAELQARHRAP